MKTEGKPVKQKNVAKQSSARNKLSNVTFAQRYCLGQQALHVLLIQFKEMPLRKGAWLYLVSFLSR